MANLRKTGGREELDAAWSQINATIADTTGIRSALLLALDRVSGGLMSRVPLAAIVADLTEVRSKAAAAIVDLGAYRTQIGNAIADYARGLARVNAGLLSRIPLAAIVADLGVLRTPVVASIVDVTAVRNALLLALDRLNSTILARSQTAQVHADLTVLRTQLVAAIVDLGVLRAKAISMIQRAECGILGSPGLANGGTAGYLRTLADLPFMVNGRVSLKGATDDVWNLSAEVDTGATEWRAYWLYLDSGGAGTFAAGATSTTSEADAIAQLPALTASRSVAGVYVAGNSCDFDAAGGLAAQGTLISGWPATVAAPAALTAVTPAALTASAGLAGINDGSTAGRLRTRDVIEYQIGGLTHQIAPTDDLWNLSAEVDTGAGEWRAYWLYVDAVGTASIVAGTTSAVSLADALAQLPAENPALCPLGVYVAGNSTDFDDVGGLAIQGDIYDGRASALADPAAITAATPAAITTSATVGLADGSTPGHIRTRADSEYRIAGRLYRAPAADDVWDLSAEADTTTGFKAYWLYLDGAGAATIVGSTEEVDAAAALAALPALNAARDAIGVYVAGPATDFDGVAGLAAQGDIYDGIPFAAAATATTPTQTSAAPAALTASALIGVVNGTTPGYIRTRADYEYQIAGRVYQKYAADDVWNLSGETDTIAAQYRAYRLYLDSAGAATIAAGSNAASAAAALAALPAEVDTKATVAVYVAGPSTDFDAVGGLSGQGDLYDGRATSVSDPAAITAESTTLIHA